MKLKTILAVISANLSIWYRKLLKKKIIPYKLLINLSDLCQSRCVYCEIWKIKPKNEITIDEIKKLFQDINSNLVWLALSGGEVTLVNYYYQLVDEAVKNCKNLKILAFTTNALAVERTIKYAEYAKNKGLDVLITISLDGDEALHDKLRGIKGNYNKCLLAYKELKKRKINCNFGLTVSDQNLNFIEKKFVDYRNKIRAITFVHNEGIYNTSKNILEDQKIMKGIKIIYKNYFIKNFQEIIEKIHIKISYLFLKNFRKKNIIPCEVINSSIHIMPSGEVKPCMFMDSLGNIKNENLSDIISSKKAKESLDIIKKDNCPKCWMNCYSVHSIMQHPFKSLKSFFH